MGRHYTPDFMKVNFLVRNFSNRVLVVYKLQFELSEINGADTLLITLCEDERRSFE